MADTTWLGNTDIIDAAANWDNGIPGTTEADLVGIFDGRISQRSPQGNMDQSGAAHPFTIVTHEDFLADIGSDGNPYKFNGTTTSRAAMIKGPGAVYLSFEAGNFSDLVVDSNVGTCQIDGEINAILIKSGQVIVRPTGNILNAVILDGYTARITILEEDNIEGVGLDWHMHAGQATVARNWPGSDSVVQVSGGEMLVTGVFSTETRIGMSGGRLNYDPLGDPSVEAPDGFIMGGTLDLSRYGGAIPFTQFIKGQSATVLGTVTSLAHTFEDYDLSDDYPGS